METYEQVDSYMQEIGLKYIKSSNEFITGLAVRTDKDYTTDIAKELNARASGQNVNNSVFYHLKNKNFEGSIFVSAAFDGGVFRHIGNMIVDNAEYFNGEIIDMACDCGIVTCFIAKTYPNCHIVGVDINELAIENAKKLAEKLSLTNVEFVCSDVFEFNADTKADIICSFRGLLDVCMDKTKGLPFFGERQWRENQYQSAFEPYAKAIGNNLNDNGAVISIERYTADYGLLGWMQALESEGINPVSDKCCEMRATDISSVKDYSVTFAKRGEATQNSLDTLNSVLSKSFKSGVGYEGYMAEFSLYYDTEGEIEFYDVYNDDGKLLHQFAISTSKSGKIITYEASGNKKKVKYFNAKKKDNAEKSIQQKLEVYSPNGYKTEKYLLLAK